MNENQVGKEIAKASMEIGRVSMEIGRTSMEIAKASKSDSTIMSAITVGTLFFFPGTFVAVSRHATMGIPAYGRICDFQPFVTADIACRQCLPCHSSTGPQWTAKM